MTMTYPIGAVSESGLVKNIGERNETMSKKTIKKIPKCFKKVGILPNGEWQVRISPHGIVVFASKEHRLRIINNGKLFILKS